MAASSSAADAAAAKFAASAAEAMAATTAEAPEGFKLLCEGSAAIMYEHDAAKGDKGEPVFYNKVQVLNRDLSIRMVRRNENKRHA